MTAAVLPDGWRLARVGDLVEFVHGFAFKGELFVEHGTKAVVTPGNFVESGGFRDVGEKQRYYEASFPGRYELRSGDLIVAMTEQAAGLLGSAAFVPATGTWLHNQRIGRVSIKSTSVSVGYLYYLFNSLQFREAVNRTAAGTKVKHTSPGKLGEIEIPLPPASEQRPVVGALRDADDIVDGVKRMIAKKEAIKQGMMQRLLTGRTRLSGFDDPWQNCRLGDVLSYEQPGRYLVETAKQLDAGRIPVLTAGKTFVLGYTNETHGVYSAHSVVIFDDFTTASKYVDFDFKAKSSAMKILSARLGADIRFLYERMQLIDFPLGDHKRHWISEYSKQEIEVPGEAEQRAISTVIADTDAEIELLRLRLVKARHIKMGLAQELLSGRKRIPVSKGAV